MLGSLYWYFEAIKKGYVHAKWNAGSELVEEKDVSGYRELGLKLIEEAADAGQNSACLFVANCYRHGTYGKKMDEEAAAYWERRAWDYKNRNEFDLRRNLLEDYSLLLSRPELRPNSGGSEETLA
jgi:TPR repeat protein